MDARASRSSGTAHERNAREWFAVSVRLFAGYDRRESVGFHVFIDSVLEHASKPVAISALDSKGLPCGSNAFTYSRFLVPWLCGFRGHAIFADGSDMLMLGDVAELDSLFDPAFAVQVVKHPYYETRHPTKYVGTRMECPNRNYVRKNWASLAIFNCAHPYWAPLDPTTLGSVAALSLLQLGGLRLDSDGKRGLQAEVGDLPDEWNRLVDEGQPVEGAKLMHWTAGIPEFKAYADAPGADQWRAARARMLETA